MDRRAFLKFTGATLTLNTVCGIPEAVYAGRELARRTTHREPASDNGVKDRLVKSLLFDHHFRDDVILSGLELDLLKSSLARLKRIQRLIGYGNFCLAGFDDALAYAKSYVRVGRFSKAELEFLEKVFYSPANAYGFMGEKPIDRMTVRIRKKKTVKIPRTGNYLYKGKPVRMYGDIKKKIGPDVVLTSGIRGVMKQFLLFLNKAAQSRGNLSMASRSLAPPGYSFHGTGDFDVGEKGFGIDNFTEKFTQTRVYNQLSDLGYIKFRYDRENDLGVRFEPWHVEVA
ncbi:MAG: M15 family metallopeptidase [Desulfobacter sp.]